MSLQREDHVVSGLERPTSVLDQEQIRTFLTVFLERYQLIEDAFLVLADQKSIDLAEGVWLDYIGKLVGVPRNALTDALYRDQLRLKISISSADGTPPVIIDLLTQFASAISVRYVEYGNAYATLTINGKENLGHDLWRMVQDIRPVGVNLVPRSDFNDNAFYLAYEVNVSQGSTFQTTDDGIIYENFETTSDGVNYEVFFTQEELDQFYSFSLRGEQNTLYYEEGSQFQFTSDGVNYVDATVTTAQGEEDFKVVDPYNEGYVPDNIRPLVWEITENSSNMT